MRPIRSVVAAATGLAAAFLSVPATAWAATPDVPEVLRISNGPYEGFQLCGAQTPPKFSTTNNFAPTFATSVRLWDCNGSFYATISNADLTTRRLTAQPETTVEKLDRPAAT